MTLELCISFYIFCWAVWKSRRKSPYAESKNILYLKTYRKKYLFSGYCNDIFPYADIKYPSCENLYSSYETLASHRSNCLFYLSEYMIRTRRIKVCPTFKIFLLSQCDKFSDLRIIQHETLNISVTNVVIIKYENSFSMINSLSNMKILMQIRARDSRASSCPMKDPAARKGSLHLRRPWRTDNVKDRCCICCNRKWSERQSRLIYKSRSAVV